MKIRIAMSVGVLLIGMGTQCFAMCSQYSKESILVKDVAQGATENIDIAIDAFAPGLLSEPVYRMQAKTLAGGSYEFEMGISGDSGSYLVRIYDGSTSAVRTENINFMDYDDYKSTIDRINASDLSVFDEVINSVTVKDYDIFNEIYQSPYSVQIVALMTQDIADGYRLSYDFAQNNVYFKKCSLITALNNGVQKDLFAEEADIVSSYVDLQNWIGKLTPTAKSAVNSRMCSNAIISSDDFDDKFYEAFILSVVQSPDGAGNVQNIVNQFASRIGINTSGYTLNHYMMISGKKFNSYKELVQALNSAAANTQSPGGGTGGGGAGGGGTPAKGLPSVQYNPKTDTSNPSVLHTDIFNDIEGYEWAKEAIVSLTEEGILDGKSKYLFAPGDNVTRAEFSKMIAKAFLNDKTASQTDFLDVNNTDWYAPYVAKVCSADVASGYGNGFFGAGDNITRQDMAVMAFKAKIAAGYEFDTTAEITDFADKAQIADYALNAVACMCEAEIINGVGENKFAPNAFATRAQAAKIIYLLMKL